MSVWVLLTIAGAFLQNLRSLLQRQLTEDLSVNGAAYVRFLFALPFVWLFLVLLSLVSQVAAPSLDLEFWLYVLSGAVTQIIATSALVAAARRRPARRRRGGRSGVRGGGTGGGGELGELDIAWGTAWTVDDIPPQLRRPEPQAFFRDMNIKLWHRSGCRPRPYIY